MLQILDLLVKVIHAIARVSLMLNDAFDNVLRFI
jgi:hypothetical protein